MDYLSNIWSAKMVPHALGDHQVMDLGGESIQNDGVVNNLRNFWNASTIPEMKVRSEQDWARLSKHMQEPSLDVTTNWRFGWNKSKLRLHAKLLRSCMAFLTPGLPQSERVWLSRAGQWHKNRVYKWINENKSQISNGSAFDESTAWLRFAGMNR